MRHVLRGSRELGVLGWVALVLLTLGACDSKVAREAALSDAQGLAVGAAVTSHGVTIGQVVEVSLGSGTAPVRVRFEIEPEPPLAAGVCASVDVSGSAPRLVLEPGTAAAGSYADVPPCALDLGGLLDGLPSLPSLPSLELPSLGEAAERAGAATREAAEGFVRGAAGEDGARDVGRALGETLRELEQGVREGSEPAPSTTTP